MPSKFRQRAAVKQRTAQAKRKRAAERKRETKEQEKHVSFMRSLLSGAGIGGAAAMTLKQLRRLGLA